MRELVVRSLGALMRGLVPTYIRCDADSIVHDVAVDLRALSPGGLFVAVRRVASDGHAVIPQALASGAAIVALERGRAPAPASPHVWLDDTCEAIPMIAANAHGRPGERLRLAGVTGTNGKTTTSYLVSAMLRAAGRLHARLGTVGNWLVDEERSADFTTPFPLELQSLLADAVSRGATDVIMEVSSHALAQRRTEPLRYGAIGMTSFSQDHLDYHETMDAYLGAKCRLASAHLAAEGIAVAAVDDHPAARDFLSRVNAPGARVWRASRGADPGAELRVLRRVERADAGIAVEIETPAGGGLLRSPLIGEFNLDNALVAIGLGLGLGLGLETILEGLASSGGAPGRLERIVVDGVDGPLVLVDYAHTPEAIARALTAARSICAGQLVIVLGCGGDRDPSKRPLMGHLAALHADRLYATSDNPRTEDPAAILDQLLEGVPPSDRPGVRRIVDRRAAIAAAVTEAAPDDLVLIAGKGHESYQIIGAMKRPFSDRAEAEAALRARRGTSPL